MDDKLKILIIDDDEVDRLNVQRSLKKAGFNVDTFFAESLSDALANVSRQSFHCIFLDYQLPGGDGLKILDEIKTLGIKTPVIFITSYSDPTVAAKMIKAGALDFISKDSLSPDIIRHSLNTALKVSELEKQREDVLRSLFEREKQYRELIDNSLALICIHGIDGTIFSVNPAVAQSLGYPQAYFTGKSLREFIAPEGLKRYELYLKTINQKKVANGLMHVLTKDGKERFWAYRNIFTEDDERKINIIGYAQDITDRIKSEQELLKAKKLAENIAKEKEQFLANMSHEIRTPMNAIIGFTDIILKTELTDEQKKYLNLVKTSGENLLAIINDILDYSKIEARKMIILNRDISISEIIYNTADLFLSSIHEKKLALNIHISKEIPAIVTGDPVRLNQILINLIGNSIKFTPQGNISVRAEVVERTAENVTVDFFVEDTGIGIPAEKLDSIFESFTQASADTTREYGGTGLGLTIVKKLTELMGGSIGVKSSYGNGTCFTFRLSFGISKTINAPVKTEATRPQDEKATGLGALKILVAEDNIMNQILAEKVLKDFGFEPEIAENGAKAVEAIRENIYDLVLMDIQMPVMDGLAATRFIRTELAKSHENLPIIAMTARALHDEKEKCIASGMNDYISKPFKPEDLLRKISKVLKTESTHKAPAVQQKINGNDFVDLSYLNQVIGNNEEMKKEMIEIFLEEAQEMLEEIEMYLSHENLADAGRVAHKLRSSLSFVASKELSRSAELIEKKSIDEGNLAEVKKIFPTFHKNCLILISRLQTEIKPR